jgi:hypothetical protein
VAERGVSTEDREQRAEQLKERIYVSFTALAVVLALRSEADHLTAGAAAATLAIAVIGTLLAVLVAEIVAHVTVHAALPSGGELAHLLRVVVGALGVLVLPLLFLGVAALDGWTLDRALQASSIALVVTLVAVGYLAARRLRLPLVQRLVVLRAEFVLGLLVIALELLAH